MATPQAGSLPWQERGRRHRLLTGGLLSALAAVVTALALKGSLGLEGLLGAGAHSRSIPVVASAPTAPLPTLVSYSQPDSAGSSIDKASFYSAQLGQEGSFLVYLPPGFASSTTHYPVLYLLHGRNGHANSFLEVGLQQDLDRLIVRHEAPPMIAVMPQDESGLSSWHNVGRRHSSTYVIEVQELVDKMLPTIPTRAARAIAGSSMGGFGAMNVALSAPSHFSVVESWLGYFNGLEGELRTATPAIHRLGLQAFLYGAEADPVAEPWEDPSFAAQLRAAGARAESAVYPGGHSLEKVSEHLETGLVFAGRSLERAERRAAREQTQRSTVAGVALTVPTAKAG